MMYKNPVYIMFSSSARKRRSLECMPPLENKPDYDAIIASWLENCSQAIDEVPAYIITDDKGQAQVKIGVHVVSLRNIDTVMQTFDAKLDVYFTWYLGKDTQIGNANDLWKPELQFINNIGKLVVNADAPRHKLLADHIEMAYRTSISGTFAEHFELQQFPLDHQKLHMRAVLWDFPQSIRRPYPNSKDPTIEIEFPRKLTFCKAPSLVYTESFIEYDTWRLLDHVELRQGRTLAERNENGIRYLSLDIAIQIERKIGFYMYNVVFPVFLLVLLSFISFFVDVQGLSDRMSITLTLVLTLIALKYVVTQYLPATSYMTYLDKYILASFFFMSLVAGQNVICYHIAVNQPSDLDDEAEKISHIHTADDFNKSTAIIISVLWFVLNICVGIVSTRTVRNHITCVQEKFHGELMEQDIPDVLSMARKTKKRFFHITPHHNQSSPSEITVFVSNHLIRSPRATTDTATTQPNNNDRPSPASV